MLLFLFIALVCSSDLYSQLNKETGNAIEKANSVSVPRFDTLVQPFADQLNVIANSGQYCFSYSQNNYSLFQKLSAGIPEFTNVWLYLYQSDTIQSNVNEQIKTFPDYWSKSYPDLPINFDDKLLVYTVCWN